MTQDAVLRLFYSSRGLPREYYLVRESKHLPVWSAVVCGDMLVAADHPVYNLVDVAPSMHDLMDLRKVSVSRRSRR